MSNIRHYARKDFKISSESFHLESNQIHIGQEAGNPSPNIAIGMHGFSKRIFIGNEAYDVEIQGTDWKTFLEEVIQMRKDVYWIKEEMVKVKEVMKEVTIVMGRFAHLEMGVEMMESHWNRRLDAFENRIRFMEEKEKKVERLEDYASIY